MAGAPNQGNFCNGRYAADNKLGKFVETEVSSNDCWREWNQMLF